MNDKAQIALRGLADIVTATPVSMRPQTWAWAVLAGVVVILAAWLAWRWHLHRVANRYRVEALDALASLESNLASPDGRAAALAQTATLLKRTALAAYPRPDVASLSGSAWLTFMREHARGVPDDLARLLDDLEYRPAPALGLLTEAETRATLKAAASWIRGHHVSA